MAAVPQTNSEKYILRAYTFILMAAVPQTNSEKYF